MSWILKNQLLCIILLHIKKYLVHSGMFSNESDKLFNALNELLRISEYAVDVDRREKIRRL